MAGTNRLTAEWFSQIIATLKSDTHQTKGHEKRTEGRVGLRCQLDLIPKQGDVIGKPITVWVRDISVNGIGLVSSKPVETGIELIASFARHGMPPLAVVYKVRYARRLSGDLYSVGANLKKVVNGDVGSKKEKPKPAEATPNLVTVDAGPVEG
jgi:hypothetical protein